MNRFWKSLIVATLATVVTYGIGFAMGWAKEINWLEAFAIFTSYSCTYMCVVQTRINYIMGAIAVSALCVLFYQQGLYSSMALQVYLFPTLLYGWFRWKSDADPRPVTSIFDFSKWWLAAYAGLTVATYLALNYISTSMGATLPLGDSAILVLSILAQFMMDNKKLENWIFWIIGNIIAIPVYFTAGLPFLALQFVYFLGNAIWGYYEWRKSKQMSEVFTINNETAKKLEELSFPNAPRNPFAGPVSLGR